MISTKVPELEIVTEQRGVSVKPRPSPVLTGLRAPRGFSVVLVRPEAQSRDGRPGAAVRGTTHQHVARAVMSPGELGPGLARVGWFI
jgi:hypothetical protein